MSDVHEPVSAKQDGPVGLETEPTGTSAERALDLLRRERANFLNYKRRVERERVEDRERARLELLRQLLPLVDDLDRALAHLPPELVGHAWTQGVSLGQRRFVEALRQLGLERFGTNGDRFDPTVHEAVAYEERPDATEQLVLNVLRPGYRASGRLLRPAQVVVVGPPSQSEHQPRHNAGTRQSVATIEQNLSD
jgi:molecular chaperone GrpE